jgi:hypothetical protein
MAILTKLPKPEDRSGYLFLYSGTRVWIRGRQHRRTAGTEHGGIQKDKGTREIWLAGLNETSIRVDHRKPNAWAPLRSA